MVYVKEDGSYGFSWQQQYDFLLREHPDDLEGIAHTKLTLLKNQQPDKTKYYEDLDAELSERIAEAWDNNPNFGYKESDDVTKAFVKEKGLSELFSDVPTLLELDDVEDVDIDFEDDELEDWRF